MELLSILLTLRLCLSISTNRCCARAPRPNTANERKITYWKRLQQLCIVMWKVFYSFIYTYIDIWWSGCCLHQHDTYVCPQCVRFNGVLVMFLIFHLFLFSLLFTLSFLFGFMPSAVHSTYTQHTLAWKLKKHENGSRVWFGEYHYMHICIGACDLCIWKHKIMRQRAVAPSFFLSLLSCGFVTFELHCIGYEATLPLRIDNCGCLNYEVYLITLCGYHAYWTDEKTIFVFEFNFGMKLE